MFNAPSPLALAALVLVPSSAVAEPVPFLHAPAQIAPPMRSEAVLFSTTVALREGRSLASLLLESGVDQGQAAAAEAVAGTYAGGAGGCRVKLALSRNPDSGATSVQRLVISTASALTIVEQREGKLKVVSSSPARARIA